MAACTFFGHREINVTEGLSKRVYEAVERLITEEKVDTFLFGSKSRFNDLCLETMTKLKEKYPHIKRVYVRAEYQYISDQYRNYLLESYEDTYYPKSVEGAGRAVYVKRNCEMIDRSRFCVVYYNENDAPTTRKSGTKIALHYAKSLNKEIILL